MAEITDVRGVGPATAIKLKKVGINSAKDLAAANVDNLIDAGVRQATATKIITTAIEMVGEVKDKTIDDIKTDVLSEIGELKAKKPKKTPVKKAKKKVKIKPVEPEQAAVSTVKGVGPKTRKTLEESGIVTAAYLANAHVDSLLMMGIGKTTAVKIINNARQQLGIEEQLSLDDSGLADIPLEEPVKKEVSKDVKSKKVKKPKKKATVVSSPMPQGIPTKKKRGVQIIAPDATDVSETAEEVEKREGWVVQARELSTEELERKKIRAEEMARARRITRDIPTTPQPIKAIKPAEAKIKGKRPVKVVKVQKKGEKITRKKDKIVDYYSTTTFTTADDPRKRGTTAKATAKQPRAVVERDTYLGKISSHRRSRRVVHNKQVVVKLEAEFNSDQIVGQKVYFTYPDNDQRVAGSIAKRFGKSSSKKVLVYFKKGIRREGIHQKIFIK